jgi:hypothetical protein
MSASERDCCCECGAPLVPDELALSRKLTGAQNGQFRCLGCLAVFFGCSTDRLREKITQFRRQGCMLFAPLPEE